VLAPPQTSAGSIGMPARPADAAAPMVLLLGPGLDATDPSAAPVATQTAAVAMAATVAPFEPVAPVQAVPPAQLSDWPRPVPYFDRTPRRTSTTAPGWWDDPAQDASSRAPSPEAGAIPAGPIVREKPGKPPRPGARDGRSAPEVPEWLWPILFEATATDRADRGDPIDDAIAMDVLSTQATIHVSQGLPSPSASGREGRAPRSDRGALASPAAFWIGAGLTALARSLRSAGDRRSKWGGARPNDEDRESPRR
jgi:hypothetical protein